MNVMTDGDGLTLLNFAHLLPLSMSMPVLECVGITLTDGGSKDMVFLRPRFVVPGILGPTIDEVYLMISVSGGKRTPPRIELGSLQFSFSQFC